MGERIFFPCPDDRSYGFDNQLRLRYGEDKSKILNPCKVIQDPNICLGVIDNNNLKPARLMLSDKDRQQIVVTIPETGEERTLPFPGKSAIIRLTKDCTKRETQELVLSQLNAEPNRSHHLHVATVADVINAGWIPYWAPLPLERKILHARLVFIGTILSGQDPLEEDARKLASIFTKVS